MSALYHEFIYQPLYNGLIFLVGSLTFVDAGVAVVILTVIVKVILFPLSKKAIMTQLAMKEVQPEVNRLKEKYKDNKEEQARRMMALYKEKGVNPFSGILLLILQLPILFALYHVFMSGLPAVNQAELYSFVKVPDHISTTFLGLFDISDTKNILLAFLVGLTQFIQAKIMIDTRGSDTSGEKGTFEADFARSMNTQTKYVLPIFIGVISYTLSGALAIYWITSNLFSIGQEMFLQRTRRNVRNP